MKLPHLLNALGLTKVETAIYIDLLEYGTQTVSSIARTSKMHRPTIYKALPGLKEKGLINERMVGKLIHYAAESPTRLKGVLQQMHTELDTVIPELQRIQKKKTPLVKRLDGKIGIHFVFDDIVNTLKKGEEFYRISSEDIHDIESIGLPKDYEERRDKLKLERLVITNPAFKAAREPRLEESLKIVPDDFLPFDYGVAQIIYGDKIAYIDYTQPLATVIENATLAQFQKDIFKMLFKRL